MLNFVICDDHPKIIKKVTNEIDKTMFNQDFDYEKHCFFDYDDKFFAKIKKLVGYKIYILDISVKTKTGIEAAKIIRKHDLNGVIIFLTAYEEKGLEVLKNEFQILTFIVKDSEYLIKLKSAILKSLKLLDCQKYLKFSAKGINYQLLESEILYIYRETLPRKSVIVTEQTKFFINKPLQFFENLLTENFVKSHRACLVNKKRVSACNQRKKLIVFDNGMQTDLMRSKFDVA